MTYIYEPAGKAREYCARALNIYTECDHGCTYCYVPNMRRKFGRSVTGTPHYRIDPAKLMREATATDKQHRILLSFTCDPYCHADVTAKGAREVLTILSDAGLKVSILSKGGPRILRDLDVIDRCTDIAIGTTLVFADPDQARLHEVRAAPTQERIDVMRELHDMGYHTWVSIEPVFDAEQSLALIAQTLDCTDLYKVGKLNHDPGRESLVDWRAFGIAAVELLRNASKSMYIKKDLREYLPVGYLLPSEYANDEAKTQRAETTCGSLPQGPPAQTTL